MQGVLVALQQQLLAAQPIALTPICEEADIHLEERGQVHLNWLMALVIAGPQRDHHPHQGSQVGASPVVVVQAAYLSYSCCQARVLAARNFSSICSFGEVILGSP